MFNLNNIKMKPKLITLFLLVGLVPLVIVGWWGSRLSENALMTKSFAQLDGVRTIKQAQIDKFFTERQGDMQVLTETVSTLRKEAFNNLTAIRESKKSQIERFFAERLGDAQVLADNPFTLEAFKALDAALDAGGGTESGNFVGRTNEQYDAPASYKTVHDKYFPTFKYYMQQYGYYDIFLMSPDQGDTSFTVTKEADFGVRAANVDSSLRDVWQIAAKEGKASLSDTKPYTPSAGAPALFVATPIKDGGEVVGVVALQISIDVINAIMGERSGMGETGEAYLVGPDQLMRSDSFLDPTNHTVVASFADPTKGKVDTEASKAAVAGQTDAKVILDYNNNPVLSSYTSIDIGETTWGLLAEIDVAEAFCPKDLEGEYFFKKYTDAYGYYDLFLMNPDGYVFYTVAQEADYQTNMLTGAYKDSGLGKLTNDVLRTKVFGLADFAPYAPSNNEPCGFIAQPVVHNNEVELVVALQLSLDAINDIMKERSGMGETGETYLIGSDMLMRSDSYLDPQNHTVMASFANPTKGKVDTEGARAALKGETNSKIINDYNGNPVLSSYAPLDLFGTQWAILAEIDLAEVRIPVVSLQYTILIVSLIAILIVVCIALFVSMGIANPLNSMMAMLKDIAEGEGDLTKTLNVTGKDEVGGVASWFNIFVGKIKDLIVEISQSSEQVASSSEELSASAQSLASSATEQASSLEETSAALEELVSSVEQNTENSQSANEIAQKAAQDAELGGKAVSETVEAMKQIADQIAIVDDIADQTNLLALNAAIEAARAGEMGKGFAVVAVEVRKLAERSQQAAKEISGLAKHSVTGAEKSGELIKQIVPDIQKTAQLVQGITNTCQEQSNTTDQIRQAVGTLDQVTQQNSATSEETAASSEELSSQAINLQEIVSRFKTDGGAPMKSRPLPSLEQHHAHAEVPRLPEPEMMDDDKQKGDSEFHEF